MNNVYECVLAGDAQGRIAAKTETVLNQPVRWEYRYDAAGRLSSVRRNGAGVELYLYDPQGRRAEELNSLRGTGDRVLRYGPDNRLEQAGEVRYLHDEFGFRREKRSEKGATEYFYAPDYRLLGVDLPDNRTVEYRHFENGMRSRKYMNGELAERYFWHSRSRLAAWDDGERVWTVEYAPNGHAARLVSQDRVLELHTDQIGSVRAVVDRTEGVVKEMLYDSFGNMVRDTNPYVRVPLGFAGGLHDWDTGLVRFGWRDYDPETGRFTAPDPIGAAGGDPDRYGYCLDDPINGVDPEGLFGMALPASVPPPLPVPTSPSLPDNQVLADQIWRLGKKNEQRLEQTWEEIKPKPQGPMRPYDHNVDYNPSHHNPNVEINGVEGPVYSKQRKKNRQSRLGGDDPFWHIPEEELDEYTNQGSDTEQRRASDIKKQRKKKAQGHNRLDGKHKR